MGDRRPQHRSSLHLRNLLAHGLRRDHGRVVVELQISLPGVAAFGGADGVLRGLDRLRHHHSPAVGGVSLKLSVIVYAQDGRGGMFSWYWFWLLPMFVVFFVSALAETNRPPFD